MTQPRKEQVKNLKTKYVRGPSEVAFGGGPVQSIVGADYAAVLAASRTGVDGGAETSSGAVIVGGRGPFVLSFNSSFTIIMPGVNSGLPITVTFVEADFVELNGVDVMTTSRAAAKINSVLGGFGVTAPVAVNLDGRLVLRSANSAGLTYGDTAFLSLSDVTPGVLQTFGFSVTNQASANGTTAPKRGIVTVSADGLGGVVQIRNLDSTPSEPSNPSMIHVAPYGYVPEVLPGRPSYARIRKPVDGSPGLELTYYRTGPVRPSVVTSMANFSALELTDQLTVSFGFGNGIVTSIHVSLENVATVAQVVDAINEEYRATTLGLGVELSRASVPLGIPGPYVFSDPSKRDSFFISFNGNDPIHINPPAGEYSASGLAAYINSRIAAASQSSEGEAVAVSVGGPGDPVRVVIQSKDTAGQTSSVRFLPGNPGGSSPGTFLETLNMLGITPGLYRGTYCAALYGNDEIEIFCPSSLPGAHLTVTPSSSSAGLKWGIPAAVTRTVTTGPVKVAVPAGNVIIPEMVEFHEEPDSYDTDIQDFDNRGDAAELDPVNGTGNIGLSALLGATTGKIDPSFIPRILDSLNLNRLSLGQNLVSSTTDQRTPRQVLPYNPSFGPVLVWQGVDVMEPTAFGLLRMYINSGDVYITRNAKVSASGSWERDVPGVDSSMFEFRSGRGSFAIYPSTSPVPWTHTDWQRSVAFNPFGTAFSPYKEGIVSLGEFRNSGSSASVPRIDVPLQLETQTLLFSAKGPSGCPVRAYVSADNAGTKSFLEVTVNASFSGAQYAKDVTGVQAVRFRFSSSAGFEMSVRSAANNAAWSSWDSTALQSDPATLITSLGGQLRPGVGLADGTTPRVLTQRYYMARRTLLFESPVTYSGSDAALAPAIPIRIYLDTVASLTQDGFTFTWNAKWDQSISRWTQDLPGQRSYAWAMSEGKFWFFSKAAGSIPWEDGPNNWDSYDAFDRATANASAYSGLVVRDGTFRVDSPGAVSNPAATAPVLLNALYAKSMVKSWGWGIYQTGNMAVVDGFNFAWIGPNSIAWDTGFATNVNANRAFIGIPGRRDTNLIISGASSIAVCRPTQTFTPARQVHYFMDFNGAIYPQGSYVDMFHVVFATT